MQFKHKVEGLCVCVIVNGMAVLAGTGASLVVQFCQRGSL